MDIFTFMFLVNDTPIGGTKQEPWNYGACDACAFNVFTVFKNLKSTFSEDNMPVHALDVFIENLTKMV